MKKIKIIAGITWAFAGLILIIILFPGLTSFSVSASKLPFMRLNPRYTGGEIAHQIIAENCTLNIRKPVKTNMKKLHKPNVSDDRLGPNEPLDEANGQRADAKGITVGEEEVPTSDHCVSKMEPDDEHNSENLIEEGLQGYMHDPLTKPRKTT